TVLPRVVAELTGRGNGIKSPELFSGPHIKGPNQTLGVVVRGDGRPFFHGRPDDHNVLDHNRCGMDADFTGFQIDLFVGAFDDTDFQINHAIFTERTDGSAGLRIERNEPVSGGHVQDTLVASAVGPVSDTASRQLSWRDSCTLALAKTVSPYQLAGLAIESNHRTSCAARCIQDALHHQRGPFQFVFRKWSKTVGLETPGNFQLVKI